MPKKNWLATQPWVYVQAPNVSAGFHGLLFKYLEHYGIGKTCMLIAEPPEVIPVFEAHFPGVAFSTLGYAGDTAEVYEQDLNVLVEPKATFDSLLSQATLEHVCRPSIFIENLARMCNKKGIIVIHTVGPDCILHRIPIDCVRFLKDFWFDLPKYLPIELLAHTELGVHQFIAYRKTK